MNDNLKNDPIEESSVGQEIDPHQQKSSLIDSLFFSTVTIVVVGVIFLVTMFISGWYIFTIKDREKDLIIAEEWVDAHQPIITSAKENKEKLNALMIEVDNAESNKSILTVELNDKKEEKRSIEIEYRRFTKEIDLNKSELNVLRESIADANVKVSTLRQEIPQLEQKVANLESKKTNLDKMVDEKEKELRKLEGEFIMYTGQIEVQKKNLETIDGVNTDFSRIQGRLKAAAEIIERNEQKLSSNLESQISILERHNQTISEQTSELKAVNNSFKSAGITINDLNNDLNSEITDLERHNQTISEQTSELKAINNSFKNAGITIKDLNNDLNSEITDLKVSVSGIQSSSKTIATVSNDVQYSKNEMANAAKSATSSSEIFSDKIKILSKDLTSLTETYRGFTDDIEKLIQLISASDKVIKRLDNQANKFRSSLDEETIKQFKIDIKNISNELTEIKKQIEIFKSKDLKEG